MNVQIYYWRKNFGTQKAERFFKERRIPCQMVDMGRHKPGPKELAVFAGKAGARSLLDTGNALVRSHPVAYTDDPDRILAYLEDRPDFLKTPIIRDGRRVIVGYDEEQLLAWLLS